MIWGAVHITADQVRKVRAKCGEYQTAFAKRFGVSKRTVIRWEQNGAKFSKWDQSRVKVWRALARRWPRLFTAEQRDALKKKKRGW